MKVVKIDNWVTRFLSQGCKEVFIKTVLQPIPTYAMTCFLLPNSLCVDMESILTRFWWNKSHKKEAFIGTVGGSCVI